MVVEPGDADACAAAVLNLLEPVRLAAARASAVARGRDLVWPAVIDRYARVLRATAHPTTRAGGSLAPLRLDRVRPPVGRDPQSWSRLAVVLSAPGMSTRDSRALSWLDRAVTALAASAAAADDPNAAGWALWGLSAVAHGAGVPLALTRRARQLRAMVAALAASPTARPTLVSDAYAVLGLTQDSIVDGSAAAVLHAAASRLDQASRANGRGLAWPWFAQRLDTPPGARLPQAMIAAGRWLDDPTMLHCGLNSLDWYARRAGLGAATAQLRLPTPLAESAADAGALIEALVDAYQMNGAARPARLALSAFAWFHGGNRYGTAVYDPDLGVAAPVLAASDGGPTTAVRAEGTLAYLGALLRLAGAGLLELPTYDASRRDLAAA
jgi:hypothetical protein